MLLENVFTAKRILSEFLKVGSMEESLFHKTLENFPQGSPIPLPLANLVLNSLEDIVRKRNFLITRYADDFVVLDYSREELNDVARILIEEFLVERGLELHPEKTGICRIKDGYNFLVIDSESFLTKDE